MTLLRRCLVVLVVAALLVPGAAATAHAGGHRKVVALAFPTVPSARFADDYSGARAGHVHRATDLFAPAGSPVYAAKAGRVVWAPRAEQAGAGFALQIKGGDGRTYAYYHLGPAGSRRSRAIAGGLTVGDRVARGQQIGVVGDSGNAAGGTPHLHFEIHDPRQRDPYGGNRLNPYPSLRAAQGRPAVRPTSSSGAPTLRMGDRGRAVSTWQRRLNRTRPGDHIAADGIFGPRTRRATSIFQRQVGLGPSGLGVVGPRTRAALKRATRDGAAGRSSPAEQTSPTANAALRLGSHGRAVVRWQRRLNRAGGYGLAADGAYGPLTHRATVSFQRDAGLGPAGLGVVGPKTRAAMRRTR